MMIPVISAPVAASAATAQTASKADLPAQTEAPRASAGETSAANLRPATAYAVNPADQSAVAARLRDQETTERTNRKTIDKDAPAGPPPAFEETLLARQTRVALDPAENSVRQPEPDTHYDGPSDEVAVQDVAAKTPMPPPSPSERAETGFAETRAIATPSEPMIVDQRG